MDTQTPLMLMAQQQNKPFMLILGICPVCKKPVTEKDRDLDLPFFRVDGNPVHPYTCEHEYKGTPKPWPAYTIPSN